MTPAPTRGIPFNRVALTGNELVYIQQVVEQGQIAGNGSFTRRCEAVLEQVLGCPRALLTTSCTHALEMAAMLLDLAPGDEVVVPTFTFVSTANAFVLHGARPVFADIRPDTLNIDEAQLPSLVTPRTRAVVPVHYAGVGCEMDAIGEIARAHSLAVVEDNAHGLFGTYRGRPLGTFGATATQSFHATKNLTCGEGGALIINDGSLVERAEILREKGTDRSRFFRGEVDKYSWVDIGSSYPPSEILAAFLLAQLEERRAVQARRQEIWESYRAGLAGWAAENGVMLPVVPDHCGVAFHMFQIVLPEASAQGRLIAHLAQHDILGVFHYVPLHLSKMGRHFGGRPGQCPVGESVSTRLVRLPFYNSMTSGEHDRVIEAVTHFQP